MLLLLCLYYHCLQPSLDAASKAIATTSTTTAAAAAKRKVIVKGILGAKKILIKGSKTKYPKKLVGTGGNLKKNGAAAAVKPKQHKIVCPTYKLIVDNMGPLIVVFYDGAYQQCLVKSYCHTQQHVLVWVRITVYASFVVDILMLLFTSFSFSLLC
jgi:hypothetical protein